MNRIECVTFYKNYYFGFAYQVVHHTFSIEYLCMNCTRVPVIATLLLVLAFDALNMDYRNLHHSHDNDAYVSPFVRNSPYIRDNAIDDECQNNFELLEMILLNRLTFKYTYNDFSIWFPIRWRCPIGHPIC